MRPPQNDLDVIEHLTECTLATVENLASLKRPVKSELARQIRIAQIGVDWLRKSHQRTCILRVAEVIRLGGSVDEWARKPNKTVTDNVSVGGSK